MLGMDLEKVEWLHVERCGGGISTDGNIEFGGLLVWRNAEGGN